MYAPVYDDKGNEVDEKTCPFCRSLAPESNEEAIEMLKKRSCGRDAKAICTLGGYYYQGIGLPQDYEKALESWHRSGELGHATAYYNIGNAYDVGGGVEVDTKKARHYFELAAMLGDVRARHNLGCIEGQAGNIDLALKHFMIAVKCGGNAPLGIMRGLLYKGSVTKEVYTEALQSYQAYLDEIKSNQRDKVAAEDEDCKYY